MQAFAARAFDFTPSGSDLTPPAGVPRADRLQIGGNGTVKLQTTGGDIVTYTVAAGAYLYVEVAIVFRTGTTVSKITGEYMDNTAGDD